MQVFKTFMKIAKKKLPGSLMYFIIFFVIMCIMSSTANQNVNTSFQASSMDVCIIDEDNSNASKALTDYLDSMHNVVGLDDLAADDLVDSLFYQTVDYILTIPDGFEEDLEGGSYDNILKSSKRHDAASGYFLDQQIDQYLSSVTLYLQGGFNLEDSTSKTITSIESLSDVKMLDFNKDTTSADTNMYYYFQFIPYVMTCLLLIGLTPILVIFNKKDLGNRINCSSLSLRAKNTQITLGCLAYSAFIWLVFIVADVIFFGPSLAFSTNGLLCILNSFVFLLIGIAITLLVSTFSPSTNALNMISNILTLGMSFLCGIFVPVWLLSDQVVAVSRFLPASWYVRITNMLGGLSGEAISMSTYWMCIGIQLLFFAAIFALFLVASKQHKSAHTA